MNPTKRNREAPQMPYNPIDTPAPAKFSQWTHIHLPGVLAGRSVGQYLYVNSTVLYEYSDWTESVSCFNARGALPCLLSSASLPSNYLAAPYFVLPMHIRDIDFVVFFFTFRVWDTSPVANHHQPTN